MKLIERTEYLCKLKASIGTPDIKVITGVRRSGKSKLMEALIQYLKSSTDANIIHINFNLLEFEELVTYKKLYEYVLDNYKEGVANFLLIDEVQMCNGFEKAINSLHAMEKFDIFITGSNAFLLSSDLATLFTGRTLKIEVYPFSFKEFCKYYEYSDSYSAFEKYLAEGGMSGAYLYKDTDQKFSYIKDIFETLVIRDIRQKYKIRNKILMDRIVDFLMDNISNITTIRNLTRILSANNEKTDHKTIGSYIQYLCNAFAFYKVRRYDIQGKKYLASNDKYYLCDHGFRYALLGTKNMDYGRVIENIVAIELMRRGYEVYVGVLYKKEIDFVAIKENEKIYIQVADSIESENTFLRETAPLLKINDAYPKILIANTRHETYDYEGIRIIDISKWLLN